MVIYRCTNLINGKKYVGKTSNYEKRLKDHLRSAKYKYYNYPIYKAINKYGIENFKWDILCECINETELNIKEIEYIKSEKSKVNEHGYNVSDGGDGQTGYKHTDEFKKNMSLRLKNNKNCVGNKLSDEHKLKLSIALKGISRPQCGWLHTEEQKKHLSDISKGKPFSETHKNNLAKANRQLHNKTIYNFRKIDTEVFKGTMLDFTEKYNLDRSSVTKLANGKVKTVKGWKLTTNTF